MKTDNFMTLVVLAATKMKGDRVCIAGINNAGQWVRPDKEMPKHMTMEDIFKNGKLCIGNFSVIKFKNKRFKGGTPHSEDCIIDPSFPLTKISQYNESDQEQFLEKYAENELLTKRENIPIMDVLKQLNRSLILIGPVEIIYAVFEEHESPRIKFKIPESNSNYRSIPCTDLKWYELGKEILKNNKTDKIILNTHKLNNILGARKIYLVLGLAREMKEKHWDMVIGVHTVPDYKVHYYD
ncbi:MAG: hypothetical protein ABIH55_01820 [Nanoarchaeota archaeon]